MFDMNSEFDSSDPGLESNGFVNHGVVAVDVRLLIESRLEGLLKKHSIEMPFHDCSAGKLTRLCYENSILDADQKEHILSVIRCCNYSIYSPKSVIGPDTASTIRS